MVPGLKYTKSTFGPHCTKRGGGVNERVPWWKSTSREINHCRRAPLLMAAKSASVACGAGGISMATRAGAGACRSAYLR